MASRTGATLIPSCAAVASAAPHTPFYLYHMPSMSGVNMPMAAFLRRAAPRIPNLAGIDCGPVRSPLAPFEAEKLAWLKARVEEWRTRL